MRLACIVGGLIIANFLYQFIMPEPDWLKACERSWFQAVAIFVVWIGGLA